MIPLPQALKYPWMNEDGIWMNGPPNGWVDNLVHSGVKLVKGEEEEGSEGRGVDWRERRDHLSIDLLSKSPPYSLSSFPPSGRQLEGFPHAQHSEPADFDLEKRGTKLPPFLPFLPLSLPSSCRVFRPFRIPLPSPLCITFALSPTRVQ